MAKKIALISASLAFFLAAPCGAIDARIFDNQYNWDNPWSVTVGDEELFPTAPYTHDWQSRSFFYVGRLNTGQFFVFNLFNWQYSFLHSWGLLVLISDQTGLLFSYDGQLPESEKTATEKGFRYQSGNILFTSSGLEHRVKIALKGFSCDVEIRNIIGPWKPGDGWAYYSKARDAYNRYAIPAPWATTSGTMTVNGRTLNADGQCFMDSSFSVQPMNRPNSPMYVFRAFSPEGTPEEEKVFINMLISYTHPEFGAVPMPMLLVARGDSWAFTTMDFTLIPTGWIPIADPPYPYPTRYIVSANANGWSLEGEFVSSRLYAATDVFQRLPRWMRAIAALFVKRPVLYRMLGEFRGRLVSPDGVAQDLAMPGHEEYVVVK